MHCNFKGPALLPKGLLRSSLCLLGCTAYCSAGCYWGNRFLGLELVKRCSLVGSLGSLSFSGTAVVGRNLALSSRY
ncbi:hypothetical protein BJX76DRAFT_324453 [Aspergillus varians]